MSYKNILEYYQNLPDKFFEEVMGVKLSSRQKAVLRFVRKFKAKIVKIKERRKIADNERWQKN